MRRGRRTRGGNGFGPSAPGSRRPSSSRRASGRSRGARRAPTRHTRSARASEACSESFFSRSLCSLTGVPPSRSIGTNTVSSWLMPLLLCSKTEYPAPWRARYAASSRMGDAVGVQQRPVSSSLMYSASEAGSSDGIVRPCGETVPLAVPAPGEPGAAFTHKGSEGRIGDDIHPGVGCVGAGAEIDRVLPAIRR